MGHLYDMRLVRSLDFRQHICSGREKQPKAIVRYASHWLAQCSFGPLFVFSAALCILPRIVVPLYSILLLVNERALELDLINGLCASLVLFSVIISMQLPIYFKLGHSKGRYWSLVPFIGALVAVMVFFIFST